MSFRVQFTISDSEKAMLDCQARAEGYPNIAALCKARAFNGKNSYGDLYIDMVNKINNLAKGETFFLRDLIDTPPALLGRWLYDNVKNGTIKNVKNLGNNGSDAQQYLKL